MPTLNSRFALLASTVLVALTTACSDAPSPVSPLLDNPAATSTATTSASTSDTSVSTFTVDPRRPESWTINGVHRVDFDIRSICDPLLSSYGPGEWDKPCTALTSPITFTAKSWTDAKGHPQVVFSPDVRFVPGKLTILTLKDRSNAAALANAKILWCATGGSTCIDEALADPSVATQLGSNGYLHRRVKHFSGYTVVAD